MKKDIIEIEESLINCAIQNQSKLFELMEKVTEDDFTSQETAKTFIVIKKIYLLGQNITRPVIKRESGATFLDNVVEDSNFDYWLNKMIDNIQKEKINTTIRDILNTWPNSTAVQMQEKLQLVSFNKHVSASKLTTPSDAEKFVLKHLDQKKWGMVQEGIKTEYKKFDKLTCGFRGGDLVLLKGFTASGKSAFAMNIAKSTAISQLIPTLYVDMELNTEQVMSRFVSMMTISTNINWANWTSNTLQYSESEEKEIIKVAGELGQSQLYREKIASPTIVELVSLIRKHHFKFGTKVVIVDYLQKMPTSGGGMTEREHLNNYSNILKVVAQQLDIVVIALVQANEDGKSQNSHQIDNDADLSVLLREPSEKEQNKFVDFMYQSGKSIKASYINRILEFTKARQTNQNVRIPIHYEGAKFRFEEI